MSLLFLCLLSTLSLSLSGALSLARHSPSESCNSTRITSLLHYHVRHVMICPRLGLGVEDEQAGSNWHVWAPAKPCLSGSQTGREGGRLGAGRRRWFCSSGPSAFPLFHVFPLKEVGATAQAQKARIVQRAILVVLPEELTMWSSCRAVLNILQVHG